MQQTMETYAANWFGDQDSYATSRCHLFTLSTVCINPNTDHLEPYRTAVEQGIQDLDVPAVCILEVIPYIISARKKVFRLIFRHREES